MRGMIVEDLCEMYLFDQGLRGKSCRRGLVQGILPLNNSGFEMRKTNQRLNV